MFTTYVLLSSKNGRHYIGSTNNLERRLNEHNRGTTKALRYSGPYKTIYTEVFETQLEARRRELELKTGKGREWLKAILVRVVA